MDPLEELFHTPEYWVERLQNDIFRLAHAYMERKGINQSKLAEELNVSKGYISQIMNGNFNFSLSKLIELALALEAAPILEFRNIGSFARAEVRRLEEMHRIYSFQFNSDKPAIPSTAEIPKWASMPFDSPVISQSLVIGSNATSTVTIKDVA